MQHCKKLPITVFIPQVVKCRSTWYGTIYFTPYRATYHCGAGVPHRVMEDDVYKGMFIPKGSLIIANTRSVSPPSTFTPIPNHPVSGISMNESIYHEPRSFKPTRYLPKSQGGHSEPLPQAQFGFGRRYADRLLLPPLVWLPSHNSHNTELLTRICPGRYLADVSLFLAISNILALYNVKRVVGPDGKEIIPEVGMVSGLTRSVTHLTPILQRILWLKIHSIATLSHINVLCRCGMRRQRNCWIK